MPRKSLDTERFGGSGSGNHPEKFHKSEDPRLVQPTSRPGLKISGSGVSGKGRANDAKISRADGRRNGSGLFVSEDVARMLTVAPEDGLTTSEYTQMLEDVLGVESDVVASIAEHMSPDLQALLPKRFLHEGQPSFLQEWLKYLIAVGMVHAHGDPSF